MAAGLDGACRADDHEAAAGILGTENHALALNALEFAWREVGDEANLLAHEFLGLIPLGDTADDSTSSHAVVDGELVFFGENWLDFDDVFLSGHMGHIFSHKDYR